MLESILSILVLVLVHLFINKLRLSHIPRSKWLSLAGGISVSYIFLHVLPEFAHYQEMVAENIQISWLAFAEHHIYGFSLIGLVVFYALERAAKKARTSQRKPGDGKESYDVKVFWIHMISFFFYNMIIGYLLLHREDDSNLGLLYYVVAMAFHFMVTDYGLYDHYRGLYQKKGRWMITAALVVGWGLGIWTEIAERYIGMIFAFLAGGVIMNVLKEELPEERKSNLWAFAAGTFAYGALVLAT